MIAWIAAHGGDAELRRRCASALRSMRGVHPQLDPSTFTELDAPGPTWMAAMTPAGTGSTIASGPGGMAVLDGLAVADGTLVEAGDVLAGTAPPVERMEGQFMVVKAGDGSLEVTSDAFGMRHAYSWRHGSTWILANSVEAIARVVGGELDAETAALFVTLGWVPDEATLWRGVSQFPAGETWTFDDTRCSRRRHFVRAALAGRRTWRYDPYPLARELQAIVRPLATARPGGLYVPLTAGLDSRLIAALVENDGLDARYYTVGTPGNVDAVAARELAVRLGRHHDLYTQTIDDVVAAWPSAAPRFVAGTDGMTSLWTFADTIGTDQIRERRAVVLHGVAGELARWHGWPLRMQYLPTPERNLAFLTRRFDRVGLVGQEPRQRARAWVVDFLDEARDEGFAERDLVPVFLLWERVRRWGGANNRKIANMTDVFTPFTTRPFVEASFRLHPARGYAEPIHRDLVKRLAPTLYAVPPEMGAWPLQVPYLTVAVERWRSRRRRRSGAAHDRNVSVYQQHLWPGRLRHHLARYLDETGSVVWHLVDRDRFASLVVGDDEAGRRSAAGAILLVATLAEYEAGRKAAPRFPESGRLDQPT